MADGDRGSDDGGNRMIQKFEFCSTQIEGLVEIVPFQSEDIRGRFTKDYSKEAFQEHGIVHDLQEVFYTTSHKGVIRALHFQRTKQQPKLVRCIVGHVFDVVVDLRRDSATFKKWLSFDLAGENYREILIPAGCAHGYLVLEDSIVSYKCAEKFYGEYDDGILWDDEEIHVDWPLEKVGGKENVILAKKDQQLQSFREFMEKFGGF